MSALDAVHGVDYFSKVRSREAEAIPCLYMDLGTYGDGYYKSS